MFPPDAISLDGVAAHAGSELLKKNRRRALCKCAAFFFVFLSAKMSVWLGVVFRSVADEKHGPLAVVGTGRSVQTLNRIKMRVLECLLSYESRIHLHWLQG